jgi:hypothetical protein
LVNKTWRHLIATENEKAAPEPKGSLFRRSVKIMRRKTKRKKKKRKIKIKIKNKIK